MRVCVFVCERVRMIFMSDNRKHCIGRRYTDFRVQSGAADARRVPFNIVNRSVIGRSIKNSHDGGRGI